MGHGVNKGRYCCCSCVNNNLSSEQIKENSTLIVPIQALDNFELAKITGWNGMNPESTIGEFFGKLKGDKGDEGDKGDKGDIYIPMFSNDFFTI